MSRGVGLETVWDGTSPQRFGDRVVTNSGDGQGVRCPHCDLLRATTLAANPVYYALTAKVGAANATRRAALAGIRTLAGRPIQQFVTSGMLTNGFGTGDFAVSPLDQATGYATFAAGGVRHDPYFVDRVEKLTGGRGVYTHRHSVGRRAFSPWVAEQATFAMEATLWQRTGTPFDRSLADWRPAAAMLGTAQGPAGAKGAGSTNTAAWTCGFTPQLAAAVWVGPDRKSLVDKAGRQVYAIGLPALTWKAFMDGALRGQPQLPLAGESPKSVRAGPQPPTASVR